MKKIYLVAVLVLFLTQLKAQDGIVFKVKYLPNTNYQATVNIGVKLDAKLTGDKKMLDDIKELGITSPINIILGIGMNGNTKTGALNNDNIFPIFMDYKIANLDLAVNGKQFPVPPKVSEKDIKVTGHMGEDGVLKIDSADGKKLNDSTENKTQQMMNMLQKQIKFPDKPLKPGDKFTQNVPMNIPISGKDNMKINAGITYKLLSISDGKAFFDMVPNFSMDFETKKLAININGTGKGKMVYSIKDNFPISKDANFKMKIKVTSDKFNMKSTAVVTSSYTWVINPQ